MVTGLKAFKKNHPDLPDIMRKAQIEISPDQVFKVIGSVKPDLHRFKKQTHPLLAYNERLGKDLLYLGVANDTVTSIKESFPVSVEDIAKEIEGVDSFYHHKWEANDMIIWDNDQVMHRSAADFEGQRLLFRVTVRNF